MGALKDKSPKVREKAAEALGNFRKYSDKITPALLETLRDDSDKVRQTTLIALGLLGNRSDLVVEAIAPFLKDDNETTRVNAAVALANLKKADWEAVPTLMEAMSNPREDVRKAVVRAMVKIARENPEKVLPVLTKSLTSKKANVAKESLIILRRMGKKAEPAIPELVAAYDDILDLNKWRALAAIVAMDSQGDAALELLKKGLKDKDPEARREALFGLLRLRSKLDDPVTPFVEALDDDDEGNLLTAISMLRSLGPKLSEAEPKLVALASHPDKRVRQGALRTLGSIRSPSGDTLNALSKALKDPEERVRMAAISALRVIGFKDPALVSRILEDAVSSEKSDKVKNYLARTVRTLEMRQDSVDRGARKE
jgi:HEAT repeat protein